MNDDILDDDCYELDEADLEPLSEADFDLLQQRSGLLREDAKRQLQAMLRSSDARPSPQG
jgi:hypothetical protein